MKVKLGLILLVLVSMGMLQITKAADQAPTNPVTISDEIFTVPGPSKHGSPQGVERPFALPTKSEVSLTIASTQKKPALNVYLLDEDNYSKYQSSGSLTNLTTVDGLSKLNTLGFEASSTLLPGKYVLIVRWAKSGFFVTAPAVGLKLFAQGIIQKPTPAPPTPTPTATFLKRIF